MSQMSDSDLHLDQELILIRNSHLNDYKESKHEENNNNNTDSIKQQHSNNIEKDPPVLATPKSPSYIDIICDDISVNDTCFNDDTFDELINKTHYKLSQVILDTDTMKQQLHEECVNFECKDFKLCPCVDRIVIILTAYQEYIESSYWMNKAITPFITYKIYSYDEILSDFQHIFRFHASIGDNNSNSKQNIFIYFEDLIAKNCNNENCKAFMRHNRDKSKPIENLKLYWNRNDINDDDEDNNNSYPNEKELELELDRIHVYFIHSVLKYINPLSPDDMVNDIEYQNMNDMNDMNDKQYIYLKNEKEIRLKAYSHLTRIRTKYISSPIIDDDDDDDMDEKKGGEIDNDRYKMEEIINSSKSHNELYDKLCCKLGEFVWQRIKSVEGVKNLYNVSARYNNIKDEVLHCPFEIITIYDWNDTLRKSTKIHNSWIGQSIRRHNEYNTDCISLKEIIGIKLYTDFDKLQHELKKCLRIETITNNINVLEMRRRLSSYQNWRECLTLTISKFSININYNRFYHGVNPKMIIERHNILSRLWGPLSATTSYHVASTFATDKGMIIEMNSQYPQLNLCYAFNASQLSDYPEESERIIGFMYVRVRKIFCKTSIIINNNNNNIADINNNISLYFFAMRLFLEGIYSMDRFLERIYLQILRLSINYRINKMNNNMDKIQNELKKKSIECREMFMLKMCENMLRPSYHYHVIIDDVSPGLRDILLRNDKEKDIMSGGDIWNIDFFKIDMIYPMMRGLSLFNNYRFNNLNIKKFIQWLEKTNNKRFILLKFVYFDYSINNTKKNKNNNKNKNKNINKNKQRNNDQMFIKLNDLDKTLRNKLENKGWEFKDKQLNGYGYRINIQNKKKSLQFM